MAVLFQLFATYSELLEKRIAKFQKGIGHIIRYLAKIYAIRTVHVKSEREDQFFKKSIANQNRYYTLGLLHDSVIDMHCHMSIAYLI